MVDSTESLIVEVDQRNRRIRELEAQIEQIYFAASAFIEYAKSSSDVEAKRALHEWNRRRP